MFGDLSIERLGTAQENEDKNADNNECTLLKSLFQSIAFWTGFFMVKNGKSKRFTAHLI